MHCSTLLKSSVFPRHHSGKQNSAKSRVQVAKSRVQVTLCYSTFEPWPLACRMLAAAKSSFAQHLRALAATSVLVSFAEAY